MAVTHDQKLTYGKPVDLALDLAFNSSQVQGHHITNPYISEEVELGHIVSGINIILTDTVCTHQHWPSIVSSIETN